MTVHEDTASIEANIQRDRAALASTIDELEDRISVDKLAEDALAMIKTNAAAYTQVVDRAVRANPMALALIGAGVAWLVLGKKKPPEPERKAEPLSRWEDEGGSVSHPHHALPDTGHADWLDKIEEMRGAASEKLRNLTQSSKSAMDNTRDYAAEKASIVSGLAQDMTSGFRHGLDDLTDAARDKIVLARQKAYQARQATARSLRKSVEAPTSMIEDYPLMAGAVALAAGAALAASLPKSDIEDRLLGSESDRLMADAAALLQQEYARAAELAGDVKHEIKDAAFEAMEQVSAVAHDAAARVKAKAFDEKTDHPIL